ncbi:hypothetical protein [Simiduia agarivorans]|uniref:NAD/FAD-utilizing enzyme n=1 Tax=Simiduia agarivorans (strain DSM 21679 / JCM 13881 / BCRC 17597 / SA1) TaxID=1117647 RepID=K4KIL4_SIMAS|nr:hypothetical protein [Simiduia agarivorans]AFU98866.1 hypothetical protein M5M_08385 [Simiduia agarivorans SA1 = DSM 21679]
MQRLYYLADNAEAASHITNDLCLQGLPPGNVHLVAENDAELERRHLPTANLLETTDLLPAGESGLLLGLAVGSLACLLMWAGGWLSEAGPLAYIGLFIFCTGLGTWLGGFVGLSLRHYKLTGFKAALDRGKVLVMVDTDSPRIARMMSHHPEAQAAGNGSTWNNPLHPHHL